MGGRKGWVWGTDDGTKCDGDGDSNWAKGEGP